MKTILILSISLLPFLSFAQVVPSSCTATGAIVERYSEEAERLALRNTFRNNSTWKDSVEINPTLRDTLLKALIAVHNAKTLPASDTLLWLNIHTYRDIITRELIICADTNLQWVKQLHKGVFNTGNYKVDSLLNLINVNNVTVWNYYPQSTNSCISLLSSSGHNYEPVIDGFLDMPGVLYAYPNSIIGDRTEIKDSVHSEYIELTYSFGWVDCTINCWYRRYWQFRVHPGCEAEYRGSYGNVLPPNIMSLESREEQVIQVAPNPFENFIKVTGVSEGSSYALYNLVGKKIQAGVLSDQKVEVSANLPPAAYFLKIRTSSGRTTTFKMIKK